MKPHCVTEEIQWTGTTKDSPESQQGKTQGGRVETPKEPKKMMAIYVSEILWVL